MDITGGLSGPTNWRFEVLKVVMAAVLGFLAAILLEKYKKRGNQVVLKAEYIESIASALEGMAVGLESRIPSYKHSHLFKHLLLNHSKESSNLLDDEMFARLKRIEEKYYECVGMIELENRYGLPNNPVVIQWLAEARRASGTLDAQAQMRKIKQ